MQKTKEISMKLIGLLFSALVTYKEKTNAISKALSISAINQVVSSGANFALGIYLVRVLTPIDFGIYGIGLAISLFYAGVCNALFLTQMVVHVPDKSLDDRLPYAARMLVGLIIFCALTVISVGAFIFFGRTWLELIDQQLFLAFSITAASVAYIIKDFFVRHAYTVRREIWALCINVAVAVVLAAMLLLKSLFAGGFNPEAALWIYAASNMLGAVVGLVLVRLPILAVRMNQLGNDLQEAWIGGRWALGGASVTWAQTQAYMYVTAVFVGPAGVAYANAARLLITPAIFLIPALSQVMMPRLASLRVSNPKKMLKISSLFSKGLIVFSVLYSLVLISLLDVVAPILLGDQYGNLGSLVAAWCLVMIFQFSRSGSSIVLQVTKQFRVLTLINTSSVVVAIGAAVILMQVVGVSGAVLGTALGELVLGVLMYRVVIKCKNDLKL